MGRQIDNTWTRMSHWKRLKKPEHQKALFEKLEAVVEEYNAYVKPQITNEEVREYTIVRLIENDLKVINAKRKSSLSGRREIEVKDKVMLKSQDFCSMIQAYAGKKGNWFTRKDVIEGCNLLGDDKTNKAIARAFASLVADGVLKREGEKASTRYIVGEGI